MTRRRGLLLAALISAPTSALALDPIVDPNADLVCNPSGGETFYPYGDVWAFLPGGTCKGADPAGANQGLDAEGAEKTDVAGHCIWVSFDNRGPIRKTGSTGTTSDHAERARKVVFGSMRKWAGYKMGKATLGGAGFEWHCPTTTQSNTDPPVSYNTQIDYDFDVGDAAVPSFNFFRGPNVDPNVTVNGQQVANRGDEYECFAECAMGQSCAGLATATVGEKTLYACTAGKTVAGGERHRVKKVRHNVLWVQGSGEWHKQTGAGAAVLASTEVVFWQDNGVIISADMLFNNENQDWQFHDPADPTAPAEGCDPNAANCYFLETVATHESGHFLGFGHVNCPEAVMVPSASTTDEKYNLSKHETAGTCAVYRPSPDGRYPASGREGDGCLDDGDCGSGNKCYFSGQSFYATAMDLMSAPNDAGRFPHRGVCVTSTTCRTDSDCDPQHGRVCQELNTTTGEKYCVAGSQNRPRSAGAVADFCTPCESGQQCNSICASTTELGIAATTPNAPPGICTAKCDPASGCAAGFTCTQVGTIDMCVPNDPAGCITAAAANKAQLNEECNQRQCAAGLTCFAFSEEMGVCLEECSKTQACKTPGYGCLPKLGTDSAGKVVLLDEGGCFKKEMKEGDNCSLPSNVMCGLKCTGSGASEQCMANEDRMCVFDTDPQQAKCFSFCSQTAPCAGANQTCAAVGAPQLGGVTYKGAPAGVCNPPALGACLKGIGETCAAGQECDSGLCETVNGAKVCTLRCDLENRSGCPLGSSCAAAGAQALCAPLGPIASRCAPPQASGCTCKSFDRGNALELALLIAAILVLRRRK